MEPIQKIRGFLAESAFDGLLLRQRNNFSWLTGGRENYIVRSEENGVADFVITEEKVLLFVSKMEERRILEEECRDLSFDFEVISAHWTDDMDALIAGKTGAMKMASDTPFMDWPVVTGELVEMRSVLNDTQQAQYTELCQTAALTLEAVCRKIKPGMTEHEVAASLAYDCLIEGIRPQVILVSSDERVYNFRHPIPTDKKIKSHVMVVICAEKYGLVANCTRFVHFGFMSDELAENRKKVARIDAAMNHATVPGRTIGAVLEKGIEQYKAEGYPDDWRYLHQGGLTGYKSREFLATPGEKSVIKAGQAYAWNPSLPGVKSEDTILVGETGKRFLTATGDWPTIPVEIDGQIYQRPGILIR